MHIWVDADACPKPIKEILFRAATRTSIAVTLIAKGTKVLTPRDNWIGNWRAARIDSGCSTSQLEEHRR